MSPNQKSASNEFEHKAHALINECYGLDDGVKSRLLNVLKYGRLTAQQKATLMRYLGQLKRRESQHISDLSNMFPGFWHALQQNLIREMLTYLNKELTTQEPC